MKNIMKKSVIFGFISLFSFTSAQAIPIDGIDVPPPPPVVTHSAVVLSTLGLPGSNPSPIVITRNSKRECRQAWIAYLAIDTGATLISGCTQD